MALGNTLFGIPLVFWGMGCLAIAVAYYRIWPQPGPKRSLPRTQWQHIVLRYFHSLVWVLLAAGCFLAGAGYQYRPVGSRAGSTCLYCLLGHGGARSQS